MDCKWFFHHWTPGLGYFDPTALYFVYFSSSSNFLDSSLVSSSDGQATRSKQNYKVNYMKMWFFTSILNKLWWEHTDFTVNVIFDLSLCGLTLALFCEWSSRLHFFCWQKRPQQSLYRYIKVQNTTCVCDVWYTYFIASWKRCELSLGQKNRAKFN